MIRWICEKCNKKWIYPVHKCLYCNGGIKKQLGTKFKVVGITKVAIPSPLHPIIPYNVLILEDEHGNRMPKKTMKDYKIGQKFEWANGELSIVKIKYDMYEAIKLGMSLIPEIKINEKTKVIIKPSIITAMYPYTGAVTNPKVLEALAQYLVSRGVVKSNIKVAEQSYFMPLEKSAGKSGIAKVCRELSIKLIDIAKCKFIEKNGYEICDEVFENDLIINLPVMKSDSRFIISGALENMTRLLSVKSQVKLFNSDIARSMDELNSSLPKYLTIADLTWGMESNGPMIGNPSFMTMLMFCQDPVSVDATFCRLAMLAIPDYVIKTKGNINPTIGGDELEANRYLIKKPDYGATPNLDVFTLGKSPDPVNYFALTGVLSKLVTSHGEKTYIAIGPQEKSEVEGKTKLIAMGDKAIESLKELGIKSNLELPGNPPDMAEQLVYIKKILQSSKEDVKVNIIDKVKAKIAKTVMKVKK